ncbi:hypothetical protein [Nocardioides acrostichi]|uniref:Uncharacterized protein n=1 Tax=Nocardioides acrostichi TaxID=2784339 RepID=A0A930Y5V7_9ACTN|nr:hypothetical protein [Nocardioides acrostichi]MBF4160281.1 hypothetical protein [Nocardioides acrostichi]
MGIGHHPRRAQRTTRRHTLRTPAFLTSHRFWRVPLVGTVAGMLVIVGTTAQASPERLLQSVSVQLDDGGAISGIDSTTVHAGSTGGSTDSTALDPSKTADQLPVRVLTSWQLGDKAGTDLSDIEGKSGRVTVQVTVQNTTVRPQKLEYDTPGAQKSAYALVGAPLTVIASAGVGDNGLAQVITDGDDGDAVTNGLLSSDSSGDAQVQWAALLAPPRLAPTATFTLVEDTTSFQVPAIDISVQPGLVTDASVQQLLTSAFDGDSASTLALETRTIDLLGDVNRVLAQAGGALGDVQQSLSGTASSLGQQTISDLNGSLSSVTSSLQSVSGSIDSLDGEIGSELNSTTSTLTGQLGDTLDSVRVLLGDPSSQKPPKDAKNRTCTSENLPGYPDKMQDKLSIYQQILQVQTRLKALRGSSHACADVVAEGLLKSIGTSDVTACPMADDPDAPRTTVTCAIHRAQSDLETQAQGLGAFKSGLLSLYNSPELTELATDVAALRTSVLDAKTTAADLKPGNGHDDDTSLTELITSLLTLNTQLFAVQGNLQKIDFGAAAKVVSSVEQIKRIADQQVAALNGLLSADALSASSGRVAGLLTTLCTDVPNSTSDASVQTYLDQATSTCKDATQAVAGLTGDVTAAKQALTTSRDQWQAVQTAASAPLDDDGRPIDIGGLVGGLNALDGVGTTVQQIQSSVSQVLTLLGGDKVNGKVKGLVDQIDALYDPTIDQTPDPNDPDAPAVKCPVVFDPPNPDETTEPALNQVRRALLNVQCLQDTVGGQFDAGFEGLLDSFAGFDTQLGTRIGQADAARQNAEDNVRALTTGLGRAIVQTGRSVKFQTRGSVKRSRASIDRGETTFTTKLGKSVDTVIDNIGTTVGAATRDLDGANQQLRADLQSVLIDLGDPSKGDTGLLGALRSNATATEGATTSIVDANGRASSFAAVRTAALGDVYLQREQLKQALTIQQELPAFGIDVAPEDTVLTVYSFHLGG